MPTPAVCVHAPPPRVSDHTPPLALTSVSDHAPTVTTPCLRSALSLTTPPSPPTPSVHTGLFT